MARGVVVLTTWLTAATGPSAPASRRWGCPMRQACNRRCRSGLPAKSPCRPNPGAAGDANLRACDTTPIIGRFRPKSLQCACPPRPERTSSGAKAPTSLCLRASPPRGSGRPRATTNSWRPIPSNGSSSNGQRARRSQPNTGSRPCPRICRSRFSSTSSSCDGASNATFEELKSELGLAHLEGRGWRGFHHHASLCIAAYAFLILERSAFPLSPLAPRKTCLSPPFSMPARPQSVLNATLPIRSRRSAGNWRSSRQNRSIDAHAAKPSRPGGSPTNACDTVELSAFHRARQEERRIFRFRHRHGPIAGASARRPNRVRSHDLEQPRQGFSPGASSTSPWAECR